MSITPNNNATPNSSGNDFFDALDELAGSGGGFSPLPEDWFEFAIALQEFKASGGGDMMAKIELTVTNDPDGHDGRKVWENVMLEGTDKNGKSKCFMLARLMQAVRYRYGDDVAGKLVPWPGYDKETRITTVPRDMAGEPDLSTWEFWFQRLSSSVLVGKVKHEGKRAKDSSGNYVTLPFREATGRIIPDNVDCKIGQWQTKDSDVTA